MEHVTRLDKRQLWNLPTETTTATSVHCSPITLPSDGILSFGTANVVTLTADVVFQPPCTATPAARLSSDDLSDPFYASSTPQVYVIAAATVLGWVLLVNLLISPRTFLGRIAGGTTGFGRGVIGGAHGGSTSLVGLGSRPWLQKAAALTVAIALTIATADTFKVSERHYPAGIDGNSLRESVENSLEIRITRVVSDIFVWLAQVQTLIRLFPRHKEKVLIKWIGFALIVLDTTFSCLNSFLIDSPRRPRDYIDAIPALSYLFELALGLLYAAWVLFYAATKRRYAFWHPKMKNISLIALLSLVSILTPVVFFVTDVTLQDVAGWGDYFRWVGAAAASVVVWEWVERIEALERDEKKDGILGREIFDGDEMLDMDPSEEMTYIPRRNDRYLPRSPGTGHGGSDTTKVDSSQTMSFTAFGRRFPGTRLFGLKTNDEELNAVTSPASDSTIKEQILSSRPAKEDTGHTNPALTPPPLTLSPPSRTDTTSAASTVYVIRQDGLANAPQPVRRRAGTTPEPSDAMHADRTAASIAEDAEQPTDASKSRDRFSTQWRAVPNPFKRKRTTPPAEVSAAIRASQDDRRAPNAANAGGPAAGKSPRWGVTGRLSAFALERAKKAHIQRARKPSEEELPWTVIPAQARGTAAWSPGIRTLQTDGSTSSPSPAPESRPSTRSATHRMGGGYSTASPVHVWASRIPEEPERRAASSDGPASGSVDLDHQRLRDHI